MSYDIETGRKRVTILRLRALLVALPGDFYLEVNAVGNLLITSGELGIEMYEGFVDFDKEDVVRRLPLLSDLE